MIKLQTVLEEDVVISVGRDDVHHGAMAVPTCKLRIDDSSDGEHVALIATLNDDEAEALGQALLHFAEHLRERTKKYDVVADRVQGWEASYGAVPEPAERDPSGDDQELQNMMVAAIPEKS
jgi:hypothetical protein